MIAFFDNIILEQVNAQQTTESGFILTGGSENKQLQVVSSGVGVPLDIRGSLKDKTVYIDWKNATKIRHNSKDYVSVRYQDVLAIV